MYSNFFAFVCVKLSVLQLIYSAVVNCNCCIFVHFWQSTSTGNTIYHMDWPLLSVGEKRDLLMIMKRSKLPIKFTSSFLIILSLESFSNVGICYCNKMRTHLLKTFVCGRSAIQRTFLLFISHNPCCK